MNDEQIDKLAEKLPAEIAPQRDLWPGIEARLKPRQTRSNHSPWGLAVAAAAVAAVALGLLWHQPVSTTVPAVAVNATKAPPLPPAIQASVQARARFAADSLRQDPGLSPATRQVVLRNLDLIEQAIGNVKLALRSDPANPQLLQMLNQLYLDEAAILAAAQDAPSQIQTTRKSL